MKKLIAILLVLIMLFSLAACGNDKTDDNNGGNADNTETENNNDSGTNENTGDNQGSTDISVDASGENVTVTLPSAFFASEDMDEFDPDEYASSNGFESAKVNDDGSVTIEVTETKYNEMMEEMAQGIKDLCTELTGGIDSPYITEITYNDDFTQFQIKVNKEEYENAIDISGLQIYVIAGFYASFAGNSSEDISIEIVDNATGDVINTYDPTSIMG